MSESRHFNIKSETMQGIFYFTMHNVIQKHFKTLKGKIKNYGVKHKMSHYKDKVLDFEKLNTIYSVSYQHALQALASKFLSKFR